MTFVICFVFSFIFTGYLIAGSDKLTEVVEWVENNSTPSFGQLPLARSRAVGAIFGNAPILCGGYAWMHGWLDTCISYNDSQWSNSHSMIKKRQFAAGVKVNSTTFWILGGTGNQHSGGYHSS